MATSFESLVWGSAPRKKRKAQTVNLGIGRCMVCGKTKAQAGRLERAHILARSKGGKVTVQLCPKHHVEFDEGRLSKAQLAKLGVPRSKYGRLRPSRRKARPVKESPYDLNIRMPRL